MSEEVIQGTDEWKKARLGKVTASRVSEVVARTKTGWGASRYNYAAELINERLTGKASDDTFKSADMLRGTELEAKARALYGLYSGNVVTTVGFFVHPRIADSGASPDGFVGDDGQVEIKCPKAATHLATLKKDKTVKKVYRDQMQWNMACTGRKWVDLVSYNPDFPSVMQMHVERFYRDEGYISELEIEVIKFIHDDVDGEILSLMKEYGGDIPIADAA